MGMYTSTIIYAKTNLTPEQIDKLLNENIDKLKSIFGDSFEIKEIETCIDMFGLDHVDTKDAPSILMGYSGSIPPD
jgi:hypothetical protein